MKEHLLYINMQRFRGGLTFKAHILLYYSTLSLRVRRKNKKEEGSMDHPIPDYSTNPSAVSCVEGGRGLGSITCPEFELVGRDHAEVVRVHKVKLPKWPAHAKSRFERGRCTQSQHATIVIHQSQSRDIARLTRRILGVSDKRIWHK